MAQYRILRDVNVMKNKYNIALIPSSQSCSVIEYARFLAPIADKYLLGERSLPHVTLYQFYAEESQIELLWETVRSKLDRHTIELAFHEFSCLTFDESTFWASLLPDHGDALMQMHYVVAETIGQPIKQNYDPHMTLMNTKNAAYEERVAILKNRYKPIRDTFVLALGKSDEIGQFTEVVFACPLKNDCTRRI